MCAPPADRTLVAAARAGDRDAFGTLVERHHATLLRTCRRALGDPAAAAEVAQDAVLAALTGLASLRDDGAFGSWLCGIGHNLARAPEHAPNLALVTGAPVLVEEAVLAQAAESERRSARSSPRRSPRPGTRA